MNQTSGGPTLVRTNCLVIMNLAKLIGVGAGRNAGLLLVHGKAVSLAYPSPRRKLNISSQAQAKFRRIRTHQHQKLPSRLNLLQPMQKGLLPRPTQKALQKLGDCLIQQLRKLWSKECNESSAWFAKTAQFLSIKPFWIIRIELSQIDFQLVTVHKKATKKPTYLFIDCFQFVHMSVTEIQATAENVLTDLLVGVIC